MTRKKNKINYKTNKNTKQIFSVMEDDKSLSDYGLTSTVAKAQQPAEVALADGKDGGYGALSIIWQ